MQYIKVTEETLRDSQEAVFEALLAEKWLVCCQAENPDDIHSYVIGNVTRLELNGYFADKLNAPAFIEYGLTELGEGETKFRLHESMVAPVKSAEILSGAVQNMTAVFNSFIIEDGMVDREKVYGKIGTDKENEVVFHNEVEG